MSNLQQLIIGWINLRQQRQALMDVLGKPDDHLLRDVGLTDEEASWLVSHGLMAWVKSHGHTSRSSPQSQRRKAAGRADCYSR
ncbi:hypothetical protein [Phyllobacterium sp. SB3]|uniref:hypothetical protein n=1 Tax=Phyllobacterium sp. SB3 TaxID=3156073 RepID=UPI0032AF070B